MVPSIENKIDLGLDSGEDYPRRFTVLPSNSSPSQRHVLAYGGDDGIISFLTLDLESTKIAANSKAKVIKRYDDGGVRAVAISNDGKRVAVGFEDGATKVYCYDDYDSSVKIHPFAAAADDTKPKKDSDDDALFSQDIGLEDDNDEDNVFAGPQFDAPIRDLQFHPNQDKEKGYFLAIATEASLLVVNATSSSTLSERYLQTQAEEHHDQCGIRAVAFEPENGKWLASLALDGRLCIWDTSMSSDPKVWKLLHREATKCIPRKDVGEIHGADAYDRSCRPLWINLSDGEDRESVSKESNEYYLGTPGKLRLVLRRIVPSEKGDSVQVRLATSDEDGGDSTSNKDNYTDGEEGGHIESIVAVAQVGNTSSILTSGRDGRVVLWDIENGKVVNPKQVTQSESIPTELISGKRVALAASSDGICHALSLPKLHSSLISRDEEESSNGNASRENSPSKSSNRKLKKKDVADENDDDDVDFADSNGKGDVSKGQVRFVDDEAAEDDDDDDDNKGQDLLVPSVGRDDATKDPMDQPGVDDDDMSEDLDLSRFNVNRVAHVPAVKEQPAFSPSATPLDLSRRFLCWNHMGAITLLRGGDTLNDRNTVDITFTDSGVRRPISFTDNQDFIVGSLGEDGGIFASDLQIDDDEDYDNDDDDVVTGLSERTKAAVSRQRKKQMRRGVDGQGQPKGSSIYFHRFETIGSVREKDWYLTLPDGERVLGSACGAGWAAVISSRRFLRLFTSGGNQGQVIWLRGEPVTMCGRGRLLAVFYHEGAPSQDGTQRLGYTFFDVGCPSAIRVLSKGSASCISKGASLKWVGFSNDFSLIAMDTDGMVSILAVAGDSMADSPPLPWEWSPVLDTVGFRKSANDRFWPVTVYDGKFVCVPLKGGASYPDAARRPVTTTLNLRLPLARSNLSPALEELSIRSNMALAQKRVVHDIAGDAESTLTANEDFEQEYLRLSAQVDKVTFKLFAATLNANKMERALDLVHRFNLEKTFDLAITLAERNPKLADLIEEARDKKFYSEEQQEDEGYGDEYDDDDDAFEGSPHTANATSRRQISPDSSYNAMPNKRSFRDDVGSFQQKKRKVF